MAEVFDTYSLLISNLSENPNFKLASYLKEFGKLKTNLQRMDFVYKDLLKSKACPTFKKDSKNDTVAVEVRKKGNEFYKQGKYREALDCYTMSILAAKTSEVLSLGYGNRSAALLKLELHAECLADIEQALENGYPDKLKPKLTARQQHSKKQKTVENKYYEPVPNFPKSEKNALIQNARNCVKIIRNEKYGRCVISTRNIEVGEILLVEPPYCAILKEEIYVHCHECFRLCYNMIPCDKCTKALYCSSTCRSKAFSRYHKYECPILLSMDSLHVDFPKRLALKMTFMSRDEWNTDDTESKQDDEIYRSDRFQEISNLETHVSQRSKQNVLGRTAASCGLFHLIRNHTSFLEEYPNEDRLKNILLLMILICGVNTVDLNELSRTLMGLYDVTAIATAIYSFFTMFNHSCWPNVSRHFHGSSLILRAQNRIKKGEQCFVLYGPNYVSYTREFRQNFLREHQFFTCTCRACEENWNIKDFKDMLQDFNVLQFFTTMKLADADVNTAKKELKNLLTMAKKAERELPPGCDYIVKDLLVLCYNIFGNKRRI